MVKQLIDSRIVSTPNVCGGHPRITDTRIRVVDIAALYNADKSAEEISDEYDLPISDVEAAMTYYFANIEEIKTLLEKDEAFIQQMKRRHTSKLPKA